MSTNLIETLGLSTEELQDRIVARACDAIGESDVADRLNELIRKTISARVAEIAETHILPHIGEYIETVTLQATSQWGEKRGEAVTFREYLIQRAEAYLTEKVDYEGKGRDESRGYSFEGRQTRIVHMIHRHLHYEIENAMKEAVLEANKQITEGIQETVKIQLRAIAKKLKVKVEA